MRIGIVIARDRKSSIELETPEDGYSFAELNGEARSVPAGRAGIEVCGDRLLVDTTAPSRMNYRVLRVAPPNGSQASRGILVRDVASGRGFHWSKIKDQKLMGVLEFRVAEGNVIMINEIRLEQYLAGVLTAEMSGDCPHEYLMAHAVMSRSWLLASARSFHPEEPYAWCNDDCCQRYQGTGDLSSAVAAAVSATHGQILVTSSGQICRASFSKNSGGITENPQSVWGVPTPGLTARFDGPDGAPEIRFFPISEANIREYLCGPWLKETQLYAAPNLVPADQLAEMLAQFNAEFSGFRWRIESTAEELRETVQASGEIKDLDVLKDIELGRRGASGRLEEILLTYRNKKGKLCRKRIASEYRIRRALRAGFLPSSAFVIGMTRNIRGHIKAATFHGAGWGHGVGLCQIGALGRALSGQSYRQILSAYYSDVCIQQIYS